MDVDTNKARESTELFAKDISETFKIRKKAFIHFMENEEWDIYVGVITETDRLHHYLWCALEDGSHPQHSFFIDFYKQIDTFIGDIYRRCGDDIPFFIVSDHGFTTIKEEVYLNTWLRQMGYLKFKKEEPETFEDMLAESSVFVLDPARFYIHLKGKYRDGTVEESEYEPLRKKIKEELLNLTIDGQRVIKEVKMKEEIYSGSLYDTAPDLVALPFDGFDLKGSINKKTVSGKGFLTGGHTRENAVFYINRKIEPGDVNIIDVAPTVLSLLGIDVDTLDGRCLV
jgi:predicted AlkP superfamily phosphohydrolase/phosphomutase